MPPTDARTIYATSALRSIPRLLSLLDRNPLSPTYGCFHRDYWLYRTSDFPDAVRQFGVHALALAYTHDFRPYCLLPASITPANISEVVAGAGWPTAHCQYYKNSNLRDWAVAALTFWARIQHADGSFDEFYPFERGWVGPTAFTTYAAAEAYHLLRGAPTSEVNTLETSEVGARVPTSEVNTLETSEVGARVRAAIRRAARFIATGEAEEDHLANHHAMALLAVSTAADVLDDASLRAKLPGLWRSFLEYQHDEGWSREYDGADPGYLSATISFLAKVYAQLTKNSSSALNVILSETKDLDGSQRSFVGRARRPPQDDTVKELRSVLAKAVDFASYFVYPDGSYGGTIGSRNTLHCYPHGFEILAPDLPMAAAIAERIAHGLADGKLVPPEIMSDRYVHYRVPEFLLAAIDARPRTGVLAQLPFERPPFMRVFPDAGMAAAVHGPAYTVVNLSKGGVIKSYEIRTGHPRLLDTGWLGELTDGRLVTSQWIDPGFERQLKPPAPPRSRRTAILHDSSSAAPEEGQGTTRWAVSGKLHAVPPPRLFTLPKSILFRAVLLLLGWYPPAAHRLKGRIRKALILGSQSVPCDFTRIIELSTDRLTVTDELRNYARLSFRRLLLGGDFPLRYVPQSRFFQTTELHAKPQEISAEDRARLNRGELLRIVRTVGPPPGTN